MPLTIFGGKFALVGLSGWQVLENTDPVMRREEREDFNLIKNISRLHHSQPHQLLLPSGCSLVVSGDWGAARALTSAKVQGERECSNRLTTIFTLSLTAKGRWENLSLNPTVKVSFKGRIQSVDFPCLHAVLTIVGQKGP